MLAKWLVSLTSNREVPGSIPTRSRFLCAVNRRTGYSWAGMRAKCILYTVSYIILGINARLYFDVKLKYLYLYLYLLVGHKSMLTLPRRAYCSRSMQISWPRKSVCAAVDGQIIRPFSSNVTENKLAAIGLYTRVCPHRRGEADIIVIM